MKTGKMLAARMYGKNDVRVEECEIPEINNHEILLKVKAAAICGTDLRMIQNGADGIDAEHPRILGHEISGVIEKVGSSVDRYQPGMHVSIAPNMGCGVCDFCVNGDTHLCDSYKALGINIDGGFAEYVRIPEEAVRQGNLMILNENLDYGEASILEPLSCVLNGQERVEIHMNDTVLILGAGPVGLMHAMLAKESGASQVFIRDLSEQRMNQCKEIDSSLIPVYGGDLKGQIMEYTDNKGVDVCIVACPSGGAQKDSLELMAVNGRILFFGGLPKGEDKVLIESNYIHYRQLMICGSTRANVRQYRQVARMVGNGKLHLRGLISARYRLKDINTAIRYAESSQGLKTLIEF